MSFFLSFLVLLIGMLCIIQFSSKPEGIIVNDAFTTIYSASVMDPSLSLQTGRGALSDVNGPLPLIQTEDPSHLHGWDALRNVWQIIRQQIKGSKGNRS